MWDWVYFWEIYLEFFLDKISICIFIKSCRIEGLFLRVIFYIISVEVKFSFIWWLLFCYCYFFVKFRILIFWVWVFCLVIGFFLVVYVFFLVFLVFRICSNDVCRIWKSGVKLRVDITLLGFENMSWIRGRRSFIFKGEGKWFYFSN